MEEKKPVTFLPVVEDGILRVSAPPQAPTLPYAPASI